MTFTDDLKLPIFLVIGALLGLGYFGLLRWNVQLYIRNSGTPRSLSVHAVRMGGAAAAFAAIARTGAPSLLAAVAGFQLVRVLAVRGKTWPPEVTP